MALLTVLTVGCLGADGITNRPRIHLAGTYKTTRVTDDWLTAGLTPGHSLHSPAKLQAIKITQDAQQFLEGEASVFSFYAESMLISLGFSDAKPVWGDWRLNGRVDWGWEGEDDGVPAATRGSFYQMFSKQKGENGQPVAYANIQVRENGVGQQVAQQITFYVGEQMFGTPIIQLDRESNDNDVRWWIAPYYKAEQSLRTDGRTEDEHLANVREQVVVSLRDTLGNAGRAKVIEATAEFRSVHTYMLLKLAYEDEMDAEGHPVIRHGMINLNGGMRHLQSTRERSPEEEARTQNVPWDGAAVVIRKDPNEIFAIMERDSIFQTIPQDARRIPIETICKNLDEAPCLETAFPMIAQFYTLGGYDFLTWNCQTLVRLAWKKLFDSELNFPLLRQAQFYKPGTGNVLRNINLEAVSSLRIRQAFGSCWPRIEKMMGFAHHPEEHYSLLELPAPTSPLPQRDTWNPLATYTGFLDIEGNPFWI